MLSHCFLVPVGITLYVISGFSFAAFEIISFPFITFTMMCLGMDLFLFILLGIHWLSKVSRLMCFIRVGILIIISSYPSFKYFFWHFYHHKIVLWCHHHVYADVLNGVHISLRCYSFSSLFFLCSLDCIISISLSSNSLSLPIYIWCWYRVMPFSFLLFSTPEFLFKNNFYLFINIFY